MEIESLKTFQCVARIGSISKAADELFLSISTVTSRIKGLEEELGKSLFHRAGRRIELTEEGLEFLHCVDRFIEMLAAGRKKMRDWKQRHTGELCLAVNTTLANYIFPLLLFRFKKEYPHIRIKMMAGTNQEVIKLVHQGTATLGIVDGGIEEEGMKKVDWFINQMVPVIPARHPLAKLKRLHIRDFLSYPMVAYTSSKQEEQLLIRAYERAGFKPSAMLHLANIEMVKKLMEEVDALAFLPLISIREEISEGKLVEVSIQPPVMMRRQVQFAYRSNIEDSLSLDVFIAFSRSFDTGFLTWKPEEKKPMGVQSSG
ncbi:LysR family transcriptional regulator [Ammoniphilus sp. YIM 78166]|uniref:LysR family transcriptional regulator n=1 Tax=Ammoniphilus sp. YIM 78166 TaxID=1644106 RepID=UPI00106FAFE4|nr:LysR family transcriptional regulator [Ammoniphilus sp. YIM 78166]